MLHVSSVRKSFGGLEVLRGCTLEVKKGSITGLIGPNGAGKTTLFNVIAGSIAEDSGQVKLSGNDVSSLTPHRLAKQGLVRTFQIPHEFRAMTVLQNMLVAAPNQAGERLFNVWFRKNHVRSEQKKVEARAWEVLEFLGLGSKAHVSAGSLSGGQKKLLELGRALMAEPKVLLLDEPVAGVNPVLSTEIQHKILQLNERGLTFLIIEHSMPFIMGISNWIYVLAEGSVMTEGSPAQIQQDQRVLDAYLGGA